jgi:hypothetical protein
MKDLSSFLTPSTDTSDLNPDVCSKMHTKTKFKQKHCQESTIQKMECTLLDDSVKLGRKPKTLINKYQDYFNDCIDLDKLRLMNRDVEDILVGISRLNWYRSVGASTPLSVKKLIYLFKELSVFSVKSISDSLEVGVKQGERYFKACSLVSSYLDNLDHLVYTPLQGDY